jgi:hypothetical protein
MIIGVNGMLGHTLADVASKKFEVVGTCPKPMYHKKGVEIGNQRKNRHVLLSVLPNSWGEACTIRGVCGKEPTIARSQMRCTSSRWCEA